MRAALEALPGVRRVVVRFEDRTADVYGEDAIPGTEEMFAALDRAGFPGSTAVADGGKS